MVQGRASARRGKLRMVRAPAVAPVLDLADGIRLYASLQEQSRHLNALLDGLRGRILRAMEDTGTEELDVDGLSVVRQLRHFAPQIDLDRAQRLLEREGRLREAQRMELDADRAREVLDLLYRQGRLSRDELPWSEPRTVEALLIRENREHRDEE
jgi:hypothetical protein